MTFCFEIAIYPIEIKAGQTINKDYFKQFTYWQQVINGPIENNFVIYGGNQDASWSNAKVIAWQNTGTLIKQIENKTLTY